MLLRQAAPRRIHITKVMRVETAGGDVDRFVADVFETEAERKQERTGGTAMIRRSEHHIGIVRFSRALAAIVDREAHAVAQNGVRAQPAYSLAELEPL